MEWNSSSRHCQAKQKQQETTMGTFPQLFLFFLKIFNIVFFYKENHIYIRNVYIMRNTLILYIIIILKLGGKRKDMSQSFLRNNKVNAITRLLIAILLLSMIISTTTSKNIITQQRTTEPTKIAPYEHQSRPTTSNRAPDTPGVPILIEDFEDQTMPPPGWTHQITNTDYNYTWHIHDKAPYEGDYFANCFYDPDLNQQDEWLITPSLDFSGYHTGIYLSFRWAMSYLWGVTEDTYDFNVKISTDGGSTWTLLWNEDTIGSFEDWRWYDTTFKTPVDLSAYADKTHVMIAFQYEGINGGQLKLDLVEIFASPAHDVGVININNPLDTMNAGRIIPSISVKNFGANAETDVPVNLKIVKKFIVGETEDFEHEILGDLNHDGEVNDDDNNVFNTTFGLNESHPDFNPEADYNNNGIVDLEDYQMWLIYYDEFPIYFGDLSHDGIINETDYLLFLEAFGHNVSDPEYNPEADYNSNGIIDLVDYQIWILHYRNYNDRYSHAVGPLPGYGTNDDWEWGKPTFTDGPPSAYSDNFCWGTNLDGLTSTNGNMVLDSCEFNLSEISSTIPEFAILRLEFYHWYNFSSPSSIFPNGGNVKISTDAGNTWTIITPVNGYPVKALPSYNRGIPNQPGYGRGKTDNWELVAFDLSDYMDETVQFRWHCGTYTSTYYITPGWYIDNVRIVYDDVNDEYNKTIPINMSFRGNQEITFPEWTPNDWQNIEDENIEYDITAYTQLYNDEDYSNDYARDEVTLHFPFFNDTGVVSVNNPVGTMTAGTITPEVTVANFGQYDQFGVPVKFSITKIYYSNYFHVEDFESGMPSSWTIIDGGSTDDTWTDTNPGERTPEGGCEGTFMIVDSDHSGEVSLMNESLITPSISCSHSFSGIFLRFNQFYNHVKDDYAQVDVSNDGGNTWTTVATYTEDTLGETTIDITDIAFGSNNVKIRFHYNDAGTFAWYWMIDNVEVYSTLLGREYNQNMYVDIQAGEQKEITFPDWTPTDITKGSKEIDYNVRGTTNLDDIGIIDKDSTNNFNKEQITLIYIDDVGVETITQPTPPTPLRAIFTEGFEDPWVADSDGDLAPPGWENHITDYTDTGPPNHYPHSWGQYGTIPYYGQPAEPYNGSYQAFLHWSYNHQDEWLITPEIDLFQYDNSQLMFWRYGHTGSPYNDHYYVRVSPTGGFEKDDFTDIIWDASDLPEGDNHYDTPYVLDLSNYDGTSIRIAWHNVDGSSNDGLWFGNCIDDVQITGEITGAYPAGTYPVEAIVKNHGTYFEDFNVNAKIYKIDGIQDVLIYESNIIITDVASDATETAVFDY